jgi:Flp pilus assembly protein TadD
VSTNNSWLIRLDIWQVTRSLIRDYPVVGAGLDTFGVISRANYVYRWVSPEQNPYHAHNLFLQTVTSLGWPGFLALLGLWMTAAYGLERASYSPDPEIYRLTVVYSASLAAYLLFNLFDVLSLGQKPGIFTWFILAGCAAIGRLRQVKLSLVRPLLVVPLLAFCLFSLTPALPRNLATLQLDQVRWRGDKADASLVDRLANDARRRGLASYLVGNTTAALAYWRDDPEALSFLQLQGRLVVITKNPREAIPWYNLALALDESAASTYFWRGIAHEQMGVAKLALADYQTAARLAPGEMDNAWQGRILFHWAILSFQLGDLPTAVATLERAIALDPAAPWYYQTLGDMLMALGDENGAAVAYEKAKG